MKFGNTEKVGAFLRGCNDYEFRYLEHVVGYVGQMKRTIKKFDITPKEFVIAMGLKLSQYKDYTGGNFKYSFSDICKFEVLWQKKETELLEKEKQIIKVPEQIKLKK